MAAVIFYLNSFANEDKPRLARENRPYTILKTSENLKDYDRLCLNGDSVDCFGENVCKVARIVCPQNTTCKSLILAVCTEKDPEDYTPRKYNFTSSM